MEWSPVGIVLVGGIVLSGLAGLWLRRRRSSVGDPWSPADVDAYLEDADLYDIEGLEELGAYDRLIELAEAGKITDERAFEELCHAIVAAGHDWEDAVEEFDELDDVSQSYRAHQEAREREPPVEIGEEVRLGVLELETHHSGECRAVGKVEGFVVFVQDVPESVTEGDILRAKIMYFNRNRTSASASLLEVDG
ncbi:hypothetical protein ACLI4R_11285 [Natrialbaceae archaeon A-chndr2]